MFKVVRFSSAGRKEWKKNTKDGQYYWVSSGDCFTEQDASCWVQDFNTVRRYKNPDGTDCFRKPFDGIFQVEQVDN